MVNVPRESSASLSLENISRLLPSGMNLRGHQAEAFRILSEYLSGGGNHGYIVMPTGAGKTLMMALLAVHAAQKSKKVLILEPTTHLCGMMKEAVHKLDSTMNIDIKTYAGFVNNSLTYYAETLVIYDEVHRALGTKTRESVEAVRDRSRIDALTIVGGEVAAEEDAQAIEKDGTVETVETVEKVTFEQKLNTIRGLHLGFTATPFLAEKQVDDTGAELIYSVKMKKLQETGILKKMHVHQVEVPLEEEDENMEEGNALYDQALDKLQELNEERKRKVIAFCANNDKAEQLKGMAEEKGLTAVVVTNQSLEGDKVQKIKDHTESLKKGEIDLIITVDLLVEGWDCPEVDTVLLLRPTASPRFIVQAVGRGIRTCDGGHPLDVIEGIGFMGGSSSRSSQTSEGGTNSNENPEKSTPRSNTKSMTVAEAYALMGEDGVVENEIQLVHTSGKIGPFYLVFEDAEEGRSLTQDSRTRLEGDLNAFVKATGAVTREALATTQAAKTAEVSCGVISFQTYLKQIWKLYKVKLNLQINFNPAEVLNKLKSLLGYALKEKINLDNNYLVFEGEELNEVSKDKLGRDLNTFAEAVGLKSIEALMTTQNEKTIEILHKKFQFRVYLKEIGRLYYEELGLKDNCTSGEVLNKLKTLLGYKLKASVPDGYLVFEGGKGSEKLNDDSKVKLESDLKAFADAVGLQSVEALTMTHDRQDAQISCGVIQLQNYLNQIGRLYYKELGLEEAYTRGEVLNKLKSLLGYTLKEKINLDNNYLVFEGGKGSEKLNDDSKVKLESDLKAFAEAAGVKSIEDLMTTHNEKTIEISCVKFPFRVYLKEIGRLYYEELGLKDNCTSGEVLNKLKTLLGYKLKASVPDGYLVFEGEELNEVSKDKLGRDLNTFARAANLQSVEALTTGRKCMEREAEISCGVMQFQTYLNQTGRLYCEELGLEENYTQGEVLNKLKTLLGCKLKASVPDGYLVFEGGKGSEKLNDDSKVKLESDLKAFADAVGLKSIEALTTGKKCMEREAEISCGSMRFNTYVKQIGRLYQAILNFSDPVKYEQILSGLKVLINVEIKGTRKKTQASLLQALDT